MATVNFKKLVLHDRWPGKADSNLGTPQNGFNVACSSVAAYPIGTKIQTYQDASAIQGPYTMIYLRYYCLSGANDVSKGDLSGCWGIFQQFCNSTCLSADGTAAIFTCTNCGGIDTGYKCGTSTGTIAIACTSLSDYDTTTDGNNNGGYAWFWCGGTCPYSDMTWFDVDSTTDGNVAAGEYINAVVDTSQLVIGYADLSRHQCGYSMEADA